jgi:hypothetical protein
MPAMDAYQDFLKARGVTTVTPRETTARGRYVIVDGVTMPIEEAQRVVQAKMDNPSVVAPTQR